MQLKLRKGVEFKVELKSGWFQHTYVTLVFYPPEYPDKKSIEVSVKREEILEKLGMPYLIEKLKDGFR